MAASNTLPVVFNRNYAEAPFTGMVFTTTALLNAYLTNPTRYAGQTVVLNEGGVLSKYILNSARDAWLPDDGGAGGGGIDIWVTATAYEIDNVIVYKPTNEMFICLADHTSSADFFTDSANWEKLANFDYLMSTGLASAGAVVSAGSGAGQVSVSAATLTFADPSSNFYKKLDFVGLTDITPPNLATQPVSYLGVDSDGNAVWSNTEPTATQRRDYVYLAKLIHEDNTTIQVISNQVEVALNPANLFQDFLRQFNLINVKGNRISAASTDLSLTKSEGYIIAAGVNAQNDIDNPIVKFLASIATITTKYRYRDGSQSADITQIDPTVYESAPAITTSTGGPNSASIQRVWLLPSGVIRLTLGQNAYTSLSSAIQGYQRGDTFEIEAQLLDNATLIMAIAVTHSCTDLSDSSKCKFLPPSIFGESIIGGAGASVSTFQNVNDNSLSDPEIVFKDGQSGLTFKDATTPITGNMVEALDNADNEVFGVSVTETKVKQLGFTDNVTVKINTTTAENIAVTDSVGTRLLKSENYELYYQDFKDVLPSTIFSSTSASLTVNDVTGTEINTSNTMASITQSGASPADSTEIVLPLPTKKQDWILTPIKILEMLEVTGGTGTFGVTLQQSNDGITFTALGSIPQLGSDVSLNKSIVQVNADSTHIKIKFSVIVADDATTLNVHRILISTDAFPVGQISITDNVTYSGYLSRTGTQVRFKTEVQNNSSRVVSVDNVIVTKYTFIKKCSFVATASLERGGSTGGMSSQITLYNSSNAVIHEVETYSVNSVSSTVAMTYEANVGDYILVNSGDPLTDTNSVNFSVSATAYADNVIVDAATSGLNTVNAGTLTISATTTAPTKGTVVTDKVWVVYNNNDTATIRFEYQQSSAGTAGSGDYLFRMPTGMEIDVTKVTPYATVEGAGAYTALNTVGVFSSGVSTDNATGSVVVYDKDFVRLFGVLDSNRGVVGSGFYAFNNAALSFSGSFTVPIKGRDMSSQLISLDVSSERENVYSARIQNNGTASIISQSSSAFKNPSRISAGIVTLDISNLNLTSIPSVTGTIRSTTSISVKTFEVTAISLTSITIETGYADASNQGLVDYDFDIMVQLQGADYRPPQAYIAGQVALTQVAYLKDVKPSGTNGGTFTSGAWQTRELNTVEGDNIVSLSGNQFEILRSGKYLIEAEAPAYLTDRHKSKLYNITDSVDVTSGSSEQTVTGVTTRSSIKAEVIITSAKIFEIQHRASTTRASDGFGLASSFGVSEVYTQIKITKLQ